MEIQNFTETACLTVQHWYNVLDLEPTLFSFFLGASNQNLFHTVSDIS